MVVDRNQARPPPTCFGCGELSHIKHFCPRQNATCFIPHPQVHEQPTGPSPADSAEYQAALAQLASDLALYQAQKDLKIPFSVPKDLKALVVMSSDSQKDFVQGGN
jgi:hypothetical protein